MPRNDAKPSYGPAMGERYEHDATILYDSQKRSNPITLPNRLQFTIGRETSTICEAPLCTEAIYHDMLERYQRGDWNLKRRCFVGMFTYLRLLHKLTVHLKNATSEHTGTLIRCVASTWPKTMCSQPISSILLRGCDTQYDIYLLWIDTDVDGPAYSMAAMLLQIVSLVYNLE
jgi:hypothetical protein